MKVNISYSVQLEEVLTSAYNLLKSEKQKLKEKTEKPLEILDKPFEDNTLVDNLQAIKNYREATVKFDEKLAEISNILLGYAQILYQQAAPEPQSEKKQNTGENE